MGDLGLSQTRPVFGTGMFTSVGVVEGWGQCRRRFCIALWMECLGLSLIDNDNIVHLSVDLLQTQLHPSTLEVEAVLAAEMRSAIVDILPCGRTKRRAFWLIPVSLDQTSQSQPMPCKFFSKDFTLVSDGNSVL